jgi:PleD family two-component response regulator
VWRLPEEVRDGVQKKILVIDDEPMVVKMVKDVLISRGHAVVTASEGYDGLLKAISERPDLILLDVVMPGLDGHDVLKQLKKDDRTKEIPVVYLSAIGDYGEQLHAMEDGSADYITKPIKPSELADRVDTYLDQAKSDLATREAHRKAGRLRTIVDIMHRNQD